MGRVHATLNALNEYNSKKRGHLPERVLEAGVYGAGVHVGGEAELLDVPQPLELRRVDDAHHERVQLDRAVNRIVY